MSLLMQTRKSDALARACELGVAMQFSNISRHIGEDAQVGRIYLPLGWPAEAGIDAQHWLAALQFMSALGNRVGRLLERAELLYSRVETGVAALPKIANLASMPLAYSTQKSASR